MLIKAVVDVDQSGNHYVLLGTLTHAMSTYDMANADRSSLCSYRLAVTDMLQRRQQHSMAQAFDEWQLYVAAKHLRFIGVRLAEQTRLNTLEYHLAAWWQQCQQQQARLYAARQQLLLNTASRVLQHWKVWPIG